jgi:L-seryl-tRNA(Ser) seleniumtransferase
VINATGVVLHTNLGRAPMAASAAARAAQMAAAYTNLEYDLERGTRGHRHAHAERLLCTLTGAERAIVVNNAAAAALLALSALARAAKSSCPAVSLSRLAAASGPRGAGAIRRRAP